MGNQESRVDNVTPKQKWEFDADVANCFANMLERSIPDYRSMRSLVYELGERFIKPGYGHNRYRLQYRACRRTIFQKTWRQQRPIFYVTTPRL